VRLVRLLQDSITHSVSAAIKEAIVLRLECNLLLVTDVLLVIIV